MSLATEPGNQPALDQVVGVEPHHPSHPAHPYSTLQAFQSLVYVIVVALFTITFIVQPFRIPSPSMEPTLLVGDFLLVDKLTGPETPPRIFAPIGEIRRGDLVVFHYSIDPSLHLVKRVIGLPGDHLRLRDGRVFINGQPLAEPYAVFQPSGPDAFRDDFPSTSAADPDVDYKWWVKMRSFIANGELTVPANSYFVLGDNRNDSKDSRFWGFVPTTAIVGKPLLVYFSLNTPDTPDTLTPGQPSAAALPGNAPSPIPAAATAPRLASPKLGFARWDRTLHILR